MPGSQRRRRSLAPLSSFSLSKLQRRKFPLMAGLAETLRYATLTRCGGMPLQPIRLYRLRKEVHMSDVLIDRPELNSLGQYEFGWSDSDAAGASARRGVN